MRSLCQLCHSLKCPRTFKLIFVSDANVKPDDGLWKPWSCGQRAYRQLQKYEFKFLLSLSLFVCCNWRMERKESDLLMLIFSRLPSIIKQLVLKSILKINLFAINFFTLNHFLQSILVNLKPVLRGMHFSQ